MQVTIFIGGYNGGGSGTDNTFPGILSAMAIFAIATTDTSVSYIAA